MLEALAVDRVTADQVLTQRAGRPDAELGAAQGLDAIADGNDEVQVVVLDLARNGSTPLGSNLCKFCTGCYGIQFPLPEGATDVLGDDRPLAPEQLGHLLLGEPDGLMVQPHVDPHLAVRCFVEDDFSARNLRHQQALPATLAASLTRSSPGMSLGRSASCRAARVRDT